MGNDLMLANLPKTFKWGRMGKAEVDPKVGRLICMFLLVFLPRSRRKRKLENGGRRNTTRTVIVIVKASAPYLLGG